MRDGLEALRRKWSRGQPMVGVEVGVYFGENMIKLLNIFPELTKLYLVDNNVYNGTPTLLENIDKLPEKDKVRIELLQMDSVSASQRFAEKTIDFVYIDANHSYASVTQDLTIWYPILKNGGFILGHDYFTDTPDVVNAVNNYFGLGNYEFFGEWFHRKA